MGVSNYYPTSNAVPTADKAITYNGGTKISATSQSQFNDESLGDVMIYATNANQQLLLGNPTYGGRSALAIGSNAISCHSTLLCTSFIGTTGISLSLGGALDSNSFPPALTAAAGQVASDTVVAKVIAASNQIFLPMAMEAYYSNQANGLCNLYAVSNIAFRPPVTFMSGVTYCNSVKFSSPITIGSNANDGMYPLCVQTATATGGVSVYAAGDVTAFSDARWKTDVVPIADALDKVLAIGGYTFRRKPMDGSDPDPGQKRAAGVLAQEVQAVLPEIVDADGDGRLHVAYGNLSALLIEATKELARGRELFRVTTTTPDELFSLPLPDASKWGDGAAAFVCGVDAYSRASASVIGGAVVGRVETPGTYNVLVIR
jgi:hypothetical protein